MAPIMAEEASIPQTDPMITILDHKAVEPSGSKVEENEVIPLDTAVPPFYKIPIDPGTPVVLALATRTSEDVIAELKSSQRIRKSSSSTTHGLTANQGRKWLKDSSEGEIEHRSDDGEDSEGETDKNAISVAAPRKIGERKRMRNAVYQSHFRDTFLKQEPKEVGTVSAADMESQSTRYLVKRKEMKNIISSPREYQVELFERAKEKNIIAVLDTGSGKTLIAVLLLRHIIEQELENRALGKQKRISFFLVDSVQLVFQQYAVLECNLDQRMESICGDMGCDLWSKELWGKHFAEDMVIVCTAEVLRHCLHHSFISMSQINLLIFDEAHHAKKDHPYARIIKDFYTTEEDKTKRPRIFGMTASPVDARTDVGKAAAELEALLHSEITTVSNPEVLQYGAALSKKEIIVKYQPIEPPFETSLYRQVKEKLGNNQLFSSPLLFSKNASSELGAWCADQLWAFCLTEEETRKLESKTERRFRARKVDGPLQVFEEQIRKLREARAIVEAHEFQPPERLPRHLSTKVMELMFYLRERYERPTDDKCIIFVKQRYTAILLAKLFDHPNIGTPHLHVGNLVGTRNGDAGDLKLSFREQVLTLIKFRNGLLNCLFTTSVAEEGLDIPDCNLVIRFDLYSTLIQYIQSRGRARKDNSRYIHMLEHNNKAHEGLIREVFEAEAALRKFCQTLPQDRLLRGCDYDMDYFLAQEKRQRSWMDPKTGAKLNYKISLTVLANFVASLPHAPEIQQAPDYVIAVQNKQFVCEVILPENSPVQRAIGRSASTKQVAKCSAAFEACVLLRKGKYLDEHFIPTFTKQLPVMRNALLAVNSKKQAAYDMRIKPDLWTVNGLPWQLFVTLLSLKDPNSLDRPSQPLALLTRSALPKVSDIPLFPEPGRQANVVCMPLSMAISVDEVILDKINVFTLRIFEDVFSKKYEPDPAKMPYFLAPINPTTLGNGNTSTAGLIAWDIIDLVYKHERLSWDECSPESFFEDRYITDPWDGSRKLWASKVTHDYKPLDLVPPNTAPRPARKRTDNILEYSCSLFDKARKRRVFSVDQPVIEAEMIPLRRNLLDDFETISDAPKRCFIVLEPLSISALPTTVVSMAYLFPAIIHRIESTLIALEACKMLHLDISPDLALEALTKDSDNTDEHGKEQIYFQRGMGKNYERLEFLGDCFLKTATTISLYTQHPTKDEYEYHVKRMCMICNQNLCNNAIKLKLYEYIRSASFSRRAWYPDGLVLVRGKQDKPSRSHKLADKTIADVCEALIGAALLTHYKTKNFDNAVRAVTELVCSEDHTITCYEDYYKLYEKPKYQTSTPTASQRDLAMQVEQKHPYHFQYPGLLRSAFTHPSYPFSFEHIPSYQRLEFLGDSLLDLACINFIFHRFPTRDPQWLTEHKMAMVSNQFFGALCVSLGFHKHLLSFSSIIQKQIRDYVAEITEARQEAEEAAVSAGKDRSEWARDFWAYTKQPPKCLPDLVEAYVGAIFVDSDYNYAEVERFFELHIRPYFEDMSIHDEYATRHPINLLNKLLNISMGCNNWGVFAQQLPDIGDGMPPENIAAIIIHDRVVADHRGANRKEAKAVAAQKAYEQLQGKPLPEFRAEYDCDCNLTADGEADEGRLGNAGEDYGEDLCLVTAI